MIPISRTRSNTDIAIVFVTPMPPMISASSEKIQPAVMISRLDVSIRTACPGSTTATIPGNLRSSRLATAFGVSPGLTVTPIVVTSCGRCASAWTTRSGSVRRDVDEAVAGVVDAGDRERALADVQRVAGAELQQLRRLVAEHRLRAAGTAALDHDVPPLGELAGLEAEDRNSSWFSTLPTRMKIAAASATPGSAADLRVERLGQNRARQVGRALLEEAEVGAADVDQLVRRASSRRR